MKRRMLVVMSVLLLFGLFGCTVTYIYEVPVAEFSFCPPNPLTLEEVTFDGSDSRVEQREDTIEIEPQAIVPGPSNNGIVHYYWDFGDGSSGTGRVVSHTYLANGIWPVTLTVVDYQNRVASLTRKIVVQNQPPIADFGWSPCAISTNNLEIQGIIPTPTATCLRFDGRFSYDPDGYIVSYQWSCDGEDWGQGPVIQHYLQRGRYCWVRLDITDNDGATDNISQLVVVE